MDSDKFAGHVAAGFKPDLIGNRPELYQTYVRDLSATAGGPAEVPPAIRELMPKLGRNTSHNAEAQFFGKATQSFGGRPAGQLEGKFGDVSVDQLADLGMNPNAVGAAHSDAMRMLDSCFNQCQSK